jgi:hypothetical protein
LSSIISAEDNAPRGLCNIGLTRQAHIYISAAADLHLDIITIIIAMSLVQKVPIGMDRIDHTIHDAATGQQKEEEEEES